MIKVYTGTMFSGKSTRLIEEYNKIEDKNAVMCFKPSKDKREFGAIRARNVEETVSSIVISRFEEILFHINENIKYIFIDEVQFINGNFNILTKFSLKGITIFIAGLKQTSELRPFGTMPYILAIADEIEILHTNCECGEIARYTDCTTDKKNDILIGDKEKYRPVCEKCYVQK